MPAMRMSSPTYVYSPRGGGRGYMSVRVAPPPAYSCWQSRGGLSQVGSSNEEEPHDNNLGSREGMAY
jgi:hypothetical protein